MSSAFLRNALVMMTGTALAQALPILVSPILTRLYTPQDYGLLAAFVGIASVLTVLATLRYELAIVLPQSDEEARAVASLATRLLISSCLIYSVLGVLFAEFLASFAGRPGQTAWVYALIPMVALLGAFQIASYIGTRNREFQAIATATVTQQGVFSALAIALGAAFKLPTGLVAARVSGQFAGTLVLARCVWNEWRFSGNSRLREVGRRYRQFPIFNCPYSLIGALGREFFVLTLTVTGQLGAAGFYGLARSVAFVPVTFMSASLSNVFYKESAVSLHTPEFGQLTAKVSSAIGRVFTPAFMVLPVIGPELFALVFGAGWREAGWYAAWLAAPAYLFLFSSWPERIFEVAGRQQVSFSIQVGFDSLTAITVVLMSFTGFAPRDIMPVLASLACLYHFSYLAAAFKIAKFGWEVFRPVVGRIVMLAVLWLGISLLARFVLPSGLSVLIVLVVLLAAYYCRLGLLYGRNFVLELRSQG